MKIKFAHRILFFFEGLLGILMLLPATFPSIETKCSEYIAKLVGESRVNIVYYAVIAIFAILSVLTIFTAFHTDGKRSDRGFITMDSSDNGKTRIAVSAIEGMVKQAVCTVDGVVDWKVNITNTDDNIAIVIDATLKGGCHVPTVTLNIQRVIRQFVEMNCGVAVQKVSVNITTVSEISDEEKRMLNNVSVVPPIDTRPEMPVFEHRAHEEVSYPDLNEEELKGETSIDTLLKEESPEEPIETETAESNNNPIE